MLRLARLAKRLAKSFTSSSIDTFTMNRLALNSLIFLLAISMGLFIILVVKLFGHEHVLVQAMMISGGYAILGCFLWVGYTGYLIYRFLPQVDPRVNPNEADLLKQRGDFFYYRIHRISTYGMAASSSWANSRLYPDFDFSTLPFELRAPLKLHTYWLWFIFIAGAMGYVSVELVEYLSLR